YHLLAGQPPFPGEDFLSKLAAHALKIPRPLRELGVDVPEGLQQVLDRMMAKAPAERYQTPANVVEALKPFLPTSAGKNAPVPPPGPERRCLPSVPASVPHPVPETGQGARRSSRRAVVACLASWPGKAAAWARRRRAVAA